MSWNIRIRYIKESGQLKAV